MRKELVAVSKDPTPVLNTPHFKAVFGGMNGSMPFDEKGLIRELEFIAFSGTVFSVQKEINDFILEVKTEEYPVEYPLFIDRRFVGFSLSNMNRVQEFPPAEKILTKMKECVGCPYIWGGNYSLGIEKLLILYPPPRILFENEYQAWSLKGLDCSGLLYESTQGATPRNVSWLLQIGRKIEAKTISEILKKIHVLDMLIWPGHVVFVLTKEMVIESKHEWGGVVVSNLVERLHKILEERKEVLLNPTQDYGFTIIRWHPEI